MAIPFILLFLLVMTHASTLLPVSRNGYYRILGRKFDKTFNPPSMNPKMTQMFAFNAPVKLSAYSKEYLPMRKRISDSVNPDISNIKFSSTKNIMPSLEHPSFPGSFKFHKDPLNQRMDAKGLPWFAPKSHLKNKFKKSIGPFKKFQISNRHGKIPFIPAPSNVEGMKGSPILSKHLLFLNGKKQRFKNEKGFVPQLTGKLITHKQIGDKLHEVGKKHPYNPEMLGLIAQKYEKPKDKKSAKFEVVPLTIKNNRVIAGQPIRDNGDFKIYDKPLPAAKDVFSNFSSGEPGQHFSVNNNFPNLGSPVGNLNSNLHPNHVGGGENFDLSPGNSGINLNNGQGVGNLNSIIPTRGSGVFPDNAGSHFSGIDGSGNQPPISSTTDIDVVLLGQSPDGINEAGFHSHGSIGSALDGIAQVHGIVDHSSVDLANGQNTHSHLHGQNHGHMLGLDENFNSGTLVGASLSNGNTDNLLTLGDASAISIGTRATLVENLSDGINVVASSEDINRIGSIDGRDVSDFVQGDGQFSVKVDVSLSQSTDDRQTDESARDNISSVQTGVYTGYMNSIEPFGPGPYAQCRLPAKVVCGARPGWEHVSGMNQWCKRNCVVVMYSSYCDDARCRCICL